jgi:hypothetical protein
MYLNLKVVLNGDPWWPASVQEEQKARCVHCTWYSTYVRCSSIRQHIEYEGT